MAMSSGKVNSTELAAALINQKDNLVDGILHAQEMIQGSLTCSFSRRRGRSSPPGTGWAACRS